MSTKEERFETADESNKAKGFIGRIAAGFNNLAESKIVDQANKIRDGKSYHERFGRYYEVHVKKESLRPDREDVTVSQMTSKGEAIFKVEIHVDNTTDDPKVMAESWRIRNAGDTDDEISDLLGRFDSSKPNAENTLSSLRVLLMMERARWVQDNGIEHVDL